MPYHLPALQSTRLSERLARFGACDVEFLGESVDLASPAAHGFDRGAGDAIDLSHAAAELLPANAEAAGEFVLKGSAG